MRKSLSAAMAAITFGGAIAASAVPVEAQARDYYYRNYRHHHDNTGTAVAAGVVGLALGAALASGSHNNGYYRGGSYYRGGGGGYYSGYAYDPYSDRAYYPEPAYYAEPGYYERRYRVCESSRWVWDPYIHQRVRIRSTYAC